MESSVATKQEYLLDGLCCAVCAGKIESGVRKIEGVETASLDFANQRLALQLLPIANAQFISGETRSLVKQLDPDVNIVEIHAITPGCKTLYLEDLGCADCARKIEERVAALPGVKRAALNFLTQQLTIEADDGSLLPTLARQASQIVAEIEPNAHVSFTPFTAPQKSTEWKTWARRAGLILGAVLFAGGLLIPLSPTVALVVFLVSYVLVGGEVVVRALKNITRGQVFDEHFLMSVATIGAFAIGEYPEGVAVMLFFQVGEAFQRLAVARSRKSISALMDIRPDFANLQTADGAVRVSPEAVGVGEMIVVKPGEKIPLDGIVASGRSALDTSALTGESLPRDISEGDSVLSGSINKSGLITVEVKKEFGESTVSKILDLVQNASGNKSQTESFITKFARYYTPVVVFAALALALIPPLLFGGVWAEWINRALVFLVVSCPCALVISVPLSYFGGIGGASRNGILVKGGNYLDALNNIDTVVFDKTGTLTKGTFKVVDIEPTNGLSNRELLALAALAESNSNHPIADSIRQAYGGTINGEAIREYEERAGLGLAVKTDDKAILAGNAQLMTEESIPFTQPDALGTIVHIALDREYAGYIVISDEIKADSTRAVAELKEIGVKRIAMLTGDSEAVAARISRDIGLDAYFAELLPQNKVEELEKLENTKTTAGTLAFVGDGINDAPVLARSDIGIAMGGVGSDAAIEAADVVLMTDEPSKIVTGIKVAKKTRRIALQNIVFALGVKVIVLVLGALGIADMWMAVFADVGVTIIAVFNAMRAMRLPRQHDERTSAVPHATEANSMA